MSFKDSAPFLSLVPPSGTISLRLEQCPSVWNNLPPSGTISLRLEQCPSVWNNLPLSGTITISLRLEQSPFFCATLHMLQLCPPLCHSSRLNLFSLSFAPRFPTVFSFPQVNLCVVCVSVCVGVGGVRTCVRVYIVGKGCYGSIHVYVYCVLMSVYLALL